MIHVDDFLYGGSQEFEQIVSHIRKSFTVGSENALPLKYLDLGSSSEGITFSQQGYIDNIEEYTIENKDDRSRILNPSEQSMFRAICGQLNWVSSQSRPDISYEVCHLSTKLNKATVDDFIRANKIIRKFKRQNIVLKFESLKKPLKLVAFCDASFANLKDGASQGGVIIFLMGQENYVSPISWISRKLRRVCHSTIAAETTGSDATQHNTQHTMALLDASETCCWLSYILSEVFTFIQFWLAAKLIPQVCRSVFRGGITYL